MNIRKMSSVIILCVVAITATAQSFESLKRSKGKSAELCGILHTRRHLAASPVFKGIPNFRETRIKMLRAEKKDDLLAILEQCREQLR